MNNIILKAEDLDGFLTESDKAQVSRMDKFYREVMTCFSLLSSSQSAAERKREEENLIRLYNEMGQLMQDICNAEKRNFLRNYFLALLVLPGTDSGSGLVQGRHPEPQSL